MVMLPGLWYNADHDNPEDETALMLTLCTSLAPRLSRFGDDGVECGMAYQQACVEGWQTLGAKVVAVNVAEELTWASEAFPNVGLIPAPSDSREHNNGRPLPYIHDLFRAAAVQAETSFCGVINSDIYLKGFREVWPSLQTILTGGLVVFRRMEMSWPSFREANLYPFGFDVFVMDKRVGAMLPDSVFAMGIPWWDFWVPMMAYLNGFDLYLVEPPVAYHLSHELRWDDDQYNGYGKVLFEAMMEAAQVSLTKPHLATRAEFVIKGLQLIEDAAECGPGDPRFTSGMSRYLQWFFDEGPGVRRLK